MKEHNRSYLLTYARRRSLKVCWLLCQNRVRGFTLPELLGVLILIGGLAVISVPSWLTFLNTQKLNKAQSQIIEVMRKAQATAKRQRINYQTSFRQQNNRVQWVIHPISVDPSTQAWSSLEEGVTLDPNPETTLLQRNNVYRVQFNHNGEVNGQWGRVTVSLSGGNMKRCVIITSLLGAMRTGENQPGRRTTPLCD